MEQKIAVHETAFVTSAFRADDEHLSGDHFAHLWLTQKTGSFAADYANTVSTYEPFAHCLRNRYFLETMLRLQNEHQVGLCLNFGSGFSMYPYLLPEEWRHIEIELPHLVRYKQAYTQKWQDAGILPQRSVQYIPFDFSVQDQQPLYEAIMQVKGDDPTFILLEGVLFFLNRSETERLFDLFSSIQEPGDYLGSVSFQPEMETKLVYQDLIDFAKGMMKEGEVSEFQSVPDAFYHSLTEYELIEQQNTLDLAKTFAPEKVLEPEKVLVENMYLMRKKL